MRAFLTLTFLVLLSGCGVFFVGEDLTNDANIIPIVDAAPTLPPGTFLFTVYATNRFNGETVDVRVDGVRVFRQPLYNTRDPQQAERIRFAATPGLRNLYVRVGNSTFNVNTSIPIRMGEQKCAQVAFTLNPERPSASAIRLEALPNEACPQ